MLYGRHCSRSPPRWSLLFFWGGGISLPRALSGVSEKNRERERERERERDSWFISIAIICVCVRFGVWRSRLTAVGKDWSSVRRPLFCFCPISNGLRLLWTQLVLRNPCIKYDRFYSLGNLFSTPEMLLGVLTKPSPMYGRSSPYPLIRRHIITAHGDDSVADHHPVSFPHASAPKLGEIVTGIIHYSVLAVDCVPPQSAPPARGDGSVVHQHPLLCPS